MFELPIYYFYALLANIALAITSKISYRRIQKLIDSWLQIEGFVEIIRLTPHSGSWSQLNYIVNGKTISRKMEISTLNINADMTVNLLVNPQNHNKVLFLPAQKK